MAVKGDRQEGKGREGERREEMEEEEEGEEVRGVCPGLQLSPAPGDRVPTLPL